MKTQKSILKAVLAVTILGLVMSCEQEKVNPALVLDEVLIPSGYRQNDAPPEDALARLTELRLDNPNDHFYFLSRASTETPTSSSWMFPQKEVKIVHVEYDKTSQPNENPNILGVIVKKIQGDWRNEEFTFVDHRPEAKGGFQSFYEYISANLKYPEQARKEGVQGKVFVEFVVDKDGKLIDVKAVKGIGAGCDQEAVRVIKEAPAWEPAKVVDMPVRVKMILPITYNLN
jgi:TonB family protein